MRYNELHDKIPDWNWIVQQENLAGLSLAQNLFEGPILVSLGSLQNLINFGT